MFFFPQSSHFSLSLSSGVILDSSLPLMSYIQTISKSCWLHFQNAARIGTQADKGVLGS